MKSNTIIYGFFVLITIFLAYVISKKTREGMENKKYLLINQDGAFLFGNKGPIQSFRKLLLGMTKKQDEISQTVETSDTEETVAASASAPTPTPTPAPAPAPPSTLTSNLGEQCGVFDSVTYNCATGLVCKSGLCNKLTNEPKETQVKTCSAIEDGLVKCTWSKKGTPDTVELEVGNKISFQSPSTIGLNVIDSEDNIDGKTVVKDQELIYTFDTPGTFKIQNRDPNEEVRKSSEIVVTVKQPALAERPAKDTYGKGNMDFRGTVNTTLSGLTCQRWDSQSPHQHSNTPAKKPNAGLTENYCRNPDGESNIWCYTTDPDKRWQYCA